MSATVTRTTSTSEPVPFAAPSVWRAAVAPYEGPSVPSSLWQMANTLIPFVGLLVLSYLALNVSVWLSLLLAIPIAGFMVRTFIIMHDCAHGSFLPWKRTSEVIGFVTGVLTFTPFDQWRRDHAMHHASSGDLDRRGHGDIDTLTVREYLARTPKQQLKYRMFRHPLTLLLGGPLQLMFGQRVRPRSAATGDKQITSVLWTNIALASAMIASILLFGWKSVVIVYLPAYYLAAMIGVWLFYVQHQFEETYWEGHKEWNYATAAIHGSSYFRLPQPLQWFTGNIGLHHVHHLGPRIPNYRLQRCHNENEMFQDVTIVTLKGGVSALRLTLWDEDAGKLVSFRDVRVREERDAARPTLN